MKKSILRLGLVLLLCGTVLLLSACGDAKGAKSPEELIVRYLKAISGEDYQAVLYLLPEEVIEYGMQELQGDREAVADYVKYAAHEYYWLAEANLAAHPDYVLTIVERGGGFPEKAKQGSVLMEMDGVRLYVNDVMTVRIELDTGGEEPVEGSFFLVRIEEKWYMISVAGDDELLHY